MKGAACPFQTAATKSATREESDTHSQKIQHARRRVVKTCMTEEEYADFTARLEHYDISQAEFIRQAITRATIRPIITVSPVKDELLAAIGKLTAEYGKNGDNITPLCEPEVYEVRELEIVDRET